MGFDPRAITIEQLEKIPKDSSWDLPRDRVYVQLGCKGCANQVCLVAGGITSLVPRSSRSSEATQDFNDVTRKVERSKTIHRGMTSEWEDSCEMPCPEAENIEVAVELLNERFGSDLQLPVQNGGAE